MIAFAIALVSLAVAAATNLPEFVAFLDPSGAAQTYNKTGALQPSNPFFKVLGTNGRTCVTCHTPTDGWSITPPNIQARFDASQGLDPLFRPVDGSNCPSDPVSTLAERKSAYSMLLHKGVIRISMPVPANADFKVIGVDDPYGCPETTNTQLAMFRRPLPGTNLPFLTGVMWDGRESPAGRSLYDNLKSQALDATLGHAQAAEAPTDEQLNEMVNLEIASYTAQAADNSAGLLNTQGAVGGAMHLAKEPFTVGMNDPLGAPGSFNPESMTVFSKWSALKGTDPTSEARASIVRGEELFNTFPITISGVAGLNDKPGVPESFTGTCSTCHNTPNVGDHSSPLAINIGVANYPAEPALDISGLPVYTIQCNSGQTVRTTDPGRALITGKCADIGKLKGPILRGLAARAPYFHNGSAATLGDVVEFYNERFNLNLTAQQKKDLAAFLGAL